MRSSSCSDTSPTRIALARVPVDDPPPRPIDVVHLLAVPVRVAEARAVRAEVRARLRSGSPGPWPGRGRRRCGTRRRRGRARTAGSTRTRRAPRRWSSSGRADSVSNRWRYHSPGRPSAVVVRVHADPPKTLRQLFGGSSPAESAPVAEDVARGAPRCRARRQRLLEPRVPVGGVVGHQVDDDAHVAPVGGGDEVVEVGEGAEPGSTSR